MINGVKVRHVPKESCFYKAGLRSGDVVTSINGEEVSDELDFRFFAADYFLEIAVRRGAANSKIKVVREEGSFLDVDIQERPINICKNRCIFCFIDQMPPGLRSGLYIKDEDFKYSFLNGNYVTLSSATQKDLEKVARLGISPLFISVHATETDVRNKMLRNSKAPPVMDQLNFLKDNGIVFHTQIVVCKGYNDGDVLLRTLEDLFSFEESLLSIAVVPVGLTKYRKFPLEQVDSQCAEWICNKVEQISSSHLQKDGFRKLFLADEFFIKAGLKIPTAKYYEDYPQIENGVGLVRTLLEQWKTCKSKLNSGKSLITLRKKTLLLTSVSAFPYLQKIISEAEKKYGLTDMDIVAVKNDYFGETVTVAGLLTAKDIMHTIKEESKNKKYGQVIIPSVMFNFCGYTLDGFSLQRICKATGFNIRTAETPEEIFCVKKVKKG
ncbi:MAG: DUF512 domain-containing protein [Fibrobacter sp.]|jgi:putative radical SAM enzyme (TIGR03279 family)|nr:DUF512 domain-containing protein [Fibrobacter sp.]